MKTFSLHAFMSLFLLQLLLMHALASDASNNKRKPSALEFFEQFQGSQKGDKVKGIHQLRKYLQSLGYINQNNISPSISLDNSDKESHIEDDYFGEDLESAIKTYQINFNLNATGTLDLQTISTMAQPRCGLPDIINGTTRMQRGSADKKYDIHYAFFEGPRWPLTKKTVTFAFQPGTRADIHEPVRVALLLWSNWAPFAFEGSNDYENADIKISFQRGDHGDGTPFDGPWHTLAHAFSDPYAVVHFNGDVNWVMGTVKGGFDMQTVALHELGHVLGLSHSSVKAASMWPSTRAGTTKGLNDDDIRRMKMLYGIISILLNTCSVSTVPGVTPYAICLSKGVKAIQIGDCKVDKDCDKSCGAPGIGRCEFQKCYCIRGRFAEGKFSHDHHYRK